MASARLPEVSVIMPAYNAAPWIGAAIGSVLAQDGVELELLVIDDGSSDDTALQVQAIADPRVRLIAGAHRGASAARNVGLAQARGRYLQHLDADDLLAAGKLAAQLTVLREAGDDCIASGRWIRFSGAQVKGETQVDALWQDLEPARWLQLALAGELMMHPAAWLLPRALLEQAGGWNEALSLNDDGEFFARQLAKSRRVLFVPAALSWYRSNLPGSLSGSRNWASAVTALDSIVARMLACDGGSASRSAAAAAWSRLAVQLAPLAPALSGQALARQCALDPQVRPELSGGGRIRWLARWIGWRAARALQYRLRGH